MYRVWSNYIIKALVAEVLHFTNGDRIVCSDLQNLINTIPSARIFEIPPVKNQSYSCLEATEFPDEFRIAVYKEDIIALIYDYTKFSTVEQETLRKVFFSSEFRKNIVLFLGFLQEMQLMYPDLQFSGSSIILHWFNTRYKGDTPCFLSQQDVDNIIFLIGGKFRKLPAPFAEFVHMYAISRGVFGRIGSYVDLLIRDLASSSYEVNYTCLPYILSNSQLADLFAEAAQKIDYSANTLTIYDAFLLKLLMFTRLSEPLIQKASEIILRPAIRERIVPAFTGIFKGQNAVKFKLLLDDENHI